MPEQQQDFNHVPSVAPLRNVTALVALIDRIHNRADHLPGMATFYGPSGYGKTTAAIYASNRFEAYTIQMRSVWTRKKLCTAILMDMGQKPARTIADMIDQISEHMARSGRPLIIDEADHLLKHDMIEIVRDIYEASDVAVVLIGEEQLPQKLQAWERVHNRMISWVGAQPATEEDAVHLARIYAPGIEIERPLLARLVKDSRQNIRRICVNLDRLRELAETRGIGRLAQSDWGTQAFFAGEAPAPRRLSA